MTTDELLDAHTLRLRTDPGYAAIWRRIFAHPVPSGRVLVAMLAWAEQADGLRAMVRAGVDSASLPMAIECPYCGVRFGIVSKKHAECEHV